MIRTILAALTATTPAFLPAFAAAHDGMAVRDAYIRSTNPATAAAFMILDNHRTVDCRLGTVTSADTAERVELHTNIEENGVMKMVRLEDGISIPAGGEHALSRGGDHVMLMGVKIPLKAGDVVTLTLDFGDCGTNEVEAVMDNDRAPAAGDSNAADDADHGAHSGH